MEIKRGCNDLKILRALKDGKYKNNQEIKEETGLGNGALNRAASQLKLYQMLERVHKGEIQNSNRYNNMKHKISPKISCFYKITPAGLKYLKNYSHILN